MGKVGFLEFLVEILVGYQRGLVMRVDMAGLVKNNWVTSGFVLQVILVGSLGVSGPCTLQLACGT